MRIHLIILLTEFLTRSVTDAFISSPTDMVMFGHLIRFKAQKAQQQKQIDKRHRANSNNNGIIFKQRSLQIECPNPSENELKSLLAFAYLKNIDQVLNYLIINHFHLNLFLT